MSEADEFNSHGVSNRVVGVAHRYGFVTTVIGLSKST